MALVDIENPVAIRDQRLLALFRFWHGMLKGRRMPRPDDLDPADMTRWADNLMLIDVPGELVDFRIRWLGPEIATMFGTPRAGTGIEAMTSEGERSSILPQYRVVIDTGLPAYYETEVELSKRGVVAQRKLILPLSSDGIKVDAVLACIYPELPHKSRARQPARSKPGKP
ncbi:PAS domain-containing protein [Dongia deserti]|uniref:PAS domain-containing protein n=1 Tax=Dongia deserti TaxID=2268030 RepID=UPI000E657EB9|nr:PAS domain-containing protein [Dongia deserti]